jgi:hypothetical protein
MCLHTMHACMRTVALGRQRISPRVANRVASRRLYHQCLIVLILVPKREYLLPSTPIIITCNELERSTACTHAQDDARHPRASRLSPRSRFGVWLRRMRCAMYIDDCNALCTRCRMCSARTTRREACSVDARSQCMQLRGERGSGHTREAGRSRLYALSEEVAEV